MIDIRKIRLNYFLHNLYRMFVYDDRETYICQENHTMLISALTKQISYLENRLKGQGIAIKYLIDVIGKDKIDHISELKYIIDKGCVCFPYDQEKTIQTPNSGYDNSKQLPYVVHKQKKIYFSSDYTPEAATSFYKDYIERENLLGGGFTAKAPHQYQTDDFFISEGDVLIDVGCAEALLSLDVIDKAKHVYLIEGDGKWIPALEATFENYRTKVTIINKYVGALNSKMTTKLSDIINENIDNTLFLKLDIEGAEYETLVEMSDALKKHPMVKIACCTYHRYEDYDKIKSFLQELGFQVKDSTGVMLYDAYDNMHYPYFRHGLVRAFK